MKYGGKGASECANRGLRGIAYSLLLRMILVVGVVVGAAVVSARRAGTTANLDVINKYFMISRMPVVSSCYWNMVHGNKPEEVWQDKEGVQIMRILGHEMSWLLKSIEVGRKSGLSRPEPEEKIRTNFIR